MKINLVAVGKRMPAWVTDAYQEYAKRMPKQYALHLIEIPLGKRTKQSELQKLIRVESRAMLSAIPNNSYVIALDVLGMSLSTENLSEQLQRFSLAGQDITLLIGGPEGLTDECLERANARWSLSKLTLPHPLVRVLLAEQLYRAYTLLTGHPYHR